MYILNNYNKFNDSSKINNSKRKYWLNVILVLVLIIIEPQTYISFYKLNQSQDIIIGLITIAILLFQKKRLKINIIQFITTIILIALLLLNKLFTGDSVAFSLVLVISIFIMFLYTQLITYKEFIDYYTKAMVVLCLYSVICTYTIIVFVDFFNVILPSFSHDIMNMRFLDAGLCFVYIPQYGGMQFRNYSVFSEPGVYQFYINIALIFELWLVKNSKYKNFRVIVLIITLITTFSTAGIIVGGLIVISFLLQNKGLRKKRNVEWVFLGLILFFIGFYIKIPKFAYNIDNIFVKLSGGGSLDSRTGSFFAYFWAWLEKPLVGWGYEAGVLEAGAKYLSQYTEHNTNTILTNLAFFGFLYGILYFILFSKFIFNIPAPIVTRIILFIAMMVSINNERFIDNNIIFITILYSISYLRNKENNNEIRENDKVYRFLR